VLAELETAGRLAAGSRVELGRVGIGAVVRDGAALPDLSTPDALKRALLAADSIVFNRASTGLYIERLLERLGVADAVRPRTTRYPDGAAVMEHVVEGRGREIGFGAMTEIALYRGKGLQLAGPLPAELQNYTSYAAAAAAPPTDVATRFLRFLAGAEAKALFAANGIE
jgi:molybdate transport system substrate-binding protein